jgi:hypothetical protein
MNIQKSAVAISLFRNVICSFTINFELQKIMQNMSLGVNIISGTVNILYQISGIYFQHQRA